MIAPRNVQGVQGCAGFCFSTQHMLSPRFTGAVGLRVGCVGLSCAQAHAHAFFPSRCAGERKKDHARAEKAYTPCTPYTEAHKAMIYIGFICVWFVLGWVFFVSGSVFGGVGR